MRIHQPALISSRLCAAIKIGDVTISIEYSKYQEKDGRMRYRYFLDSAENEFEGNDLQSGCGGGNLQEGLGNLLVFLGAAGEAYGYEQRSGSRFSENTDLFPAWVNEWAYQNSDELTEMVFTIEESETVLIDESV